MRSIEEKISYRLVFVGLVSMVLTALLVTSLYRRGYNQQVRADMRTHAAAITAAMEQGCAPESLVVEDLRITLIDKDGTVRFESVPVTEEENHLERPEVKQALAEGSGFAQRKSRTVGYETTYYALRMADGNILRIARNTAGTYAFFDQSLPAVVLVLVFILALSVLLSATVSRTLIRPINRMAEHLDEIDSLPVPYRELQPFVRLLKQDYALREESEALRMEFTANVSHELKTPLTGISGYAELLENGMVAPEDVPTFGGKIHREAARMSALVGDILKLSALDSKQTTRQEPERSPVDLSHIGEEVAADLSLHAKNSYVTIRKDLQPAVVQGDPKLLAELCANLVDNAIRYNHPGGWVCISTRQTSHGSVLEVSDNGIGIPEEAQGRIFERFYRVDKSRSKATGGTGLGLAIVKHIAALHGGKITIESQPGEGTSICVFLY